MLIPVVLSGGAGTRLWPVSREASPKPFMKLGGDLSLLQRTLRCSLPLADGLSRTAVSEELQPDADGNTTLGSKHRLENPGVVDLVMIEVQCGDYLGEDDIVRFDDVYGRTPPA